MLKRVSTNRSWGKETWWNVPANQRADLSCCVLFRPMGDSCALGNGVSISWLQNSSNGKIWVRVRRSYTRLRLCITGCPLSPVSLCQWISGCLTYWRTTVLLLGVMTKSDIKSKMVERKGEHNISTLQTLIQSCSTMMWYVVSCDAHVLFISLALWLHKDIFTFGFWVQVWVGGKSWPLVNGKA